MFQHRLLLDSACYQCKPASDIKKINGRIVNEVRDVDIVEFSKQVTSPNGRTWIAAYLEERRSNDCWKSQSIFALDFDCGITSRQVLDRLKEYGLECAFIYETFSSSPEKEKFRAVFQLDQVIIDRAYRDQIQKDLMIVFPESDKACKDASRIFFGGRGLVYTDYTAFLNLELLFVASTALSVKNAKPEHLSQTLTRIEKKRGCVKNGNLYIRDMESSKNHTKKNL